MEKCPTVGNIPPSAPPIRGASCSPPSLRSGGCSSHPSRAPSPQGAGSQPYAAINPYSAPVIRGHMCLVCCTRPIASIAYFTTGNLGTFRMSARAKKRLWGGRPRSEDHRPTTFFRLSRRHPPLPRLPFVPCAHEAIVLGQKAVSESHLSNGTHGGKAAPIR